MLFKRLFQGSTETFQNFELLGGERYKKLEIFQSFDRIVLPKSGSVQFFALFAELRTGPRVQFRHLAELWTELVVLVQFRFEHI